MQSGAVGFFRSQKIGLSVCLSVGLELSSPSERSCLSELSVCLRLSRACRIAFAHQHIEIVTHRVCEMLVGPRRAGSRAHLCVEVSIGCACEAAVLD